MDLIGLLIFIVVVALILYLIKMLPLDPKLMQIVYVVVIGLVVIYLLSVLFGVGYMPNPRIGPR